MSLISDGLHALGPLDRRAYSFVSFMGAIRPLTSAHPRTCFAPLVSIVIRPPLSLCSSSPSGQCSHYRSGRCSARSPCALRPVVLDVFSGSSVFVLSATLVVTMVNIVDEITPAPVTSSSLRATSSVPVVELADETVLTPPDPTMEALFDIIRALSSSSVAPPPVPVATPSVKGLSSDSS